MSKALVIAIGAGFGLLGGFGYLDYLGLAEPVWARVLPISVLERGLSSREAWRQETKERLEEAEELAHATEADIEESRENRLRLVRQLSGRLEGRSDSLVRDAQAPVRNDTVAAALVRSVLAEEEKIDELRKRLPEQEKLIDTLNARLIADENGLSPVELTELNRPSQLLEALPSTGETRSEATGRILAEALASNTWKGTK